jgi:hypothetical protein
MVSKSLTSRLTVDERIGIDTYLKLNDSVVVAESEIRTLSGITILPDSSYGPGTSRATMRIVERLLAINKAEVLTNQIK